MIQAQSVCQILANLGAEKVVLVPLDTIFWLGKISTRAIVDPMTSWKTIPGFPEHEASDDGQIRRSPTDSHWRAGRLLTQQIDGKGYAYVSLDGRKQAVHRLVCAAFNGPAPAGALCRHLNDDKTLNRPENLAWGTMVENAQDAKRNGCAAFHATRFCRKTAQDLRSQGFSYRAIGAQLGVSHVAVVLGLKG